MARIRTIKPEFWTSDQVAAVSRDARLLFIGIWNFCDDRGVHPASLNRLKMEVFPADALSMGTIGGMVRQLISVGLLQEFESEGQSYWHVTGWKHQKIEKPSFKYPIPPEGPVTTPQVRNSTSDRGIVADSSPPEGKGREGKGKEGTNGLVGRSVGGSLEGVQGKPLESLWLNEVESEHLTDAGALCALHRRLHEESPQVFLADQRTLLQIMAAASRARQEGRDAVRCFVGAIRHRAFKFLKRDRRCSERMLKEHRDRIKKNPNFPNLHTPLCDGTR